MNMRVQPRYWLPVAIVFIVSITSALAQTQSTGSGSPPAGGQGQPGTPPGGSTPKPPGPSEPSPDTRPIAREPTPSQQPVQIQRPIFLRGRVIMADGTPTPANIMIERVCNGTPQPEAYTDGQGRFNFQVGAPPRGFVPDASYSGSAARIGFGTGGDADSMGGVGLSAQRSLMGCELRASLPGFRSDSVSLSMRGPFDIDVGAIVLHRIAEVEGYTISLTSAQAPKSARKAYENGIKRARNGKWEKAEEALRRAVEEYPKYAVAWQALGQVLEAQDRDAEAREAYDRAVEADGSYLSPYLKIALLAARENNWRDMAEASDRVIRMNPYDFPEAYYFRSVAKASLNDLAGSEQDAREALDREVDQRYPQVESLLGLILASQGKYDEASEHLERYLELRPEAEDREAIEARLEEVEQRIAAVPDE